MFLFLHFFIGKRSNDHWVSDSNVQTASWLLSSLSSSFHSRTSFFALSISLPSVTSGKTADCIAIVKSKRSCSSLRLFYSSIVSALISPHLVLCWFFLLLLFFSLCFCSLPPFSHNSLWLFEFLNASKIDRERLCSLSSFSLFLFPVAPFPLSSLFPFALSLSLSVSLFFLN